MSSSGRGGVRSAFDGGSVRVVVRAAVVGVAVTAEVVGLDVTSAEMVFVIKQWWGICSGRGCGIGCDGGS